MKRYLRFSLGIFVIVFLVSVFTPPATAAEPIRIGVLAVLTGAFAQLGLDSVDGVKLAFEEVDYKIGGRPVKLYIEDTAATPTLAVEKTRAVISRDNCRIVLGPLSGAEGLAVKKSADEWPNATIVVAASAAEDITMRGVKPNVWRCSFSGAQATFPLGEWAYNKGYRKMITVGEDYAFPYAQVGGLLKTFCDAGGRVPKKFWVPIGTSDYSAIFPQIPKDIDVIYLCLSGTDAINFTTQMEDFGYLGRTPILGGTVTVDETTLMQVGEQLEGVVSSSVFSGDLDRPQLKSLDAKFRKLRGRPTALFVELYYRAAKWTILALQKVNGNVEDQDAFRHALQHTEFEGPASRVSFDAYHNVVTDVFISQVKKVGGVWRNSPIKIYPQVSQFWTYDPGEYQKQPPYTRDFPDCP